MGKLDFQKLKMRKAKMQEKSHERDLDREDQAIGRKIEEYEQDRYRSANNDW